MGGLLGGAREEGADETAREAQRRALPRHHARVARRPQVSPRLVLPFLTLNSLIQVAIQQIRTAF